MAPRFRLHWATFGTALALGPGSCAGPSAAPPAAAPPAAAPPSAAPSSAAPSSAQPSTTGPPPSSATTTGPGPFSAVAPKAGALQTVLHHCTPGIQPTPRQGCHIGRLSTLIGEVIAQVRAETAKHPDPARFAAITAAVADLEKSPAALSSCEPFFGGGIGPASYSCTAAWENIQAQWRKVLNAGLLSPRK